MFQQEHAPTEKLGDRLFSHDGFPRSARPCRRGWGEDYYTGPLARPHCLGGHQSGKGCRLREADGVELPTLPESRATWPVLADSTRIVTA